MFVISKIENYFKNIALYTHPNFYLLCRDLNVQEEEEAQEILEIDLQRDLPEMGEILKMVPEAGETLVVDPGVILR